MKPKLRTYVQVKDFDNLTCLVKSNMSRCKMSITAQFLCGILPCELAIGRFLEHKIPLLQSLQVGCSWRRIAFCHQGSLAERGQKRDPWNLTWGTEKEKRLNLLENAAGWNQHKAICHWAWNVIHSNAELIIHVSHHLWGDSNVWRCPMGTLNGKNFLRPRRGWCTCGLSELWRLF